MAEMGPEIAAEVHSVCLAAAEETAGALNRALGGSFTVNVGDAQRYSDEERARELAGAGLLLLLKFGDSAMAAILPESSGLTPAWCASPDATGLSKLATLAQELCLLFATAPPAPGEYRAQFVENIETALARGGIAADATIMPLSLSSEGKTGQLSLIWPLERPEELYVGEPEHAGGESHGHGPAAAINIPTHVPPVRDLSQLPGYSRSLLKISVPVCVQLATKKELVQEVISLAPGSIIKFEKGCDELLQMIVGDYAVAEGEAVKIGEKFGFRVTAMLMPREHFAPVRKPRRA